MSNPKCPDCRGGVELELIDSYLGQELICYPKDPHYKCPKCKQEYDVEDIDEQDD